MTVRLIEINVKSFGAVGDGITNDTSSFTGAISAAILNSSTTATIYIPGGIYLINSSLIIPAGIRFVGDGQYGFGTWSAIKFNSNSDCFVFNGASCVGGGGLFNLNILKGSGLSGAAIKLIATDGTHRPGEFIIENVLIDSYDGSSLWGRGLVIDGSAANTAGSKGVRSVHLNKFRVANCNTSGEYILINQGTHVIGSYVQIDPASGATPAGMTVTGETANLLFSSFICNGNTNLQGTALNTKINGYISDTFTVGSGVSGGIFHVNGQALVVASGAYGIADGHWTSGVSNANDAKFRVKNSFDSRTYLGNQVVAGGYRPSDFADVGATTNLGSVYNAYPLDTSAQQAGFYAYNPATTNAGLFEINVNRVKIGSPNSTFVDFIYGNSPKGTIGPSGIFIGMTGSAANALEIKSSNTGTSFCAVLPASGAGAGNRFGYIFDSGNYGYITADPNAGNGMRISRLNSGPLLIGSNTNASVNSSTFTEEARFDTNGDLVLANDLKIGNASGGIHVKEGSNASMGTGTLTAGSVVISTTKVTANSRIFLTTQVSGGTPGALCVSARGAGTFTVTSTSGTDTSTFAWWIIEPS